MPKTVEHVESMHEAAQPAVGVEPQLEAMPRAKTPLQPTRRTSPMPPPNGSPSAMRAARMIGVPSPTVGSVMRAGMMNGLQGATGNARAGRLAVQAKLAVNRPGDAYEREADRVAEGVIRMSASEAVNSAAASDPATGDRRRQTTIAQRVPVGSNSNVPDMSSDRIQAKLTVGAPNDAYEQEAERTANAVSRMPKPETQQDQVGAPHIGVSDQPPTPKLQRTSTNDVQLDREQPGIRLEQQLANSKGGGQRLPDHTRASLEPALGADLGRVRVHTGADAVEMSKSLGAQAFTHGSDIYFDEGKYDPESSAGRHLLTHELTHTVQQGGSAVKPKGEGEFKDGDYLHRDTPDIQASWYNFHIPFTDYEFDPSIEGVKTAAGLAVDAAKQGAEWVKDRVVEGIAWIVDQLSDLLNSGFEWLKGKYEEIKQFANSAFDGIGRALRNAVSAITSPMGFLQNALLGVNADAFGTAWGMISSAANAAWQTLKVVVNGLLQLGGGLWGAVSRFVDWLFARAGSLLDNRLFNQLPQRLQDGARFLFNKVRSLWESIRDFWTGIWQRLTSLARETLAAVERFVQHIASYTITEVLATIRKLKEAWDFVKRLTTDPEAVIRPILEQLAGMIETGTPPKASAVAHERREAAWSQRESSASGTIGAIQRKPNGRMERSTTTRAEVNENIDEALELEWAKVVSRGIGGMLWDTLVNMFWPPATIAAIGHEFTELWTKDWADAVDSLFMPRSILDDVGGFFHDVWSNLLILLDFPLALLRRVINILMLLMGYVTIILVLIGFVGGGIAGGGAFSVPAALAGAWAGLQLSFALGAGLLAAYLGVEAVTALKAVLDLYTARQTQAEKARDYKQFAASVIGIGIALLIALIFFLLAEFVSSVVRLIKGEVPPQLKGGKGEGETPEDESGKTDQAEQAGKPKMTIAERLAEFFKRLRDRAPAKTAREALDQIRDTLNQVEDEFSGVPRKDPPPPPNMPDGRMYPPLEDFTTQNPDGSMSARTRGHRIDLGADGSITIRNIRSGAVDFTKPGGGGGSSGSGGE